METEYVYHDAVLLNEAARDKYPNFGAINQS